MADVDRGRFRAEINLAVETFINRACELTGTNEADVTQEQPNGQRAQPDQS